VDLSDDVGIHGPYQFCLIAFAEFVVGRKTSYWACRLGHSNIALMLIGHGAKREEVNKVR
jgi:hypothetical protein